MRKEFSAVSDLVKAGLERLGLAGAVKERSAVEVWEEVVGHETASVTRVERVREGVMYVTCRDSIWAQELHFLRPVIVRKLNERLGAQVVKEIRLSGVGFRKRAAQQEERDDSKRRKQTPRLTQSDLEVIDKAAGQIEDPDLAERVSRGLKASRKIRKSRE
ncbi:MAG: DUF721 domain-containing protein [Armatimonadetes bacterium]|nr:DUF721 domain-containing protein [Armatimonadota bacterium]